MAAKCSANSNGRLSIDLIQKKWKQLLAGVLKILKNSSKMHITVSVLSNVYAD